MQSGDNTGQTILDTFEIKRKLEKFFGIIFLLPSLLFLTNFRIDFPIDFLVYFPNNWSVRLKTKYSS